MTLRDGAHVLRNVIEGEARKNVYGEFPVMVGQVE
jgi:hypothetical protein